LLERKRHPSVGSTRRSRGDCGAMKAVTPNNNSTVVDRGSDVTTSRGRLRTRCSRVSPAPDCDARSERRESPPLLAKWGIRTFIVSPNEASPKTARPEPHRRAPTRTRTSPSAATVSPRSSFTRTSGAAQATTTGQRRARKASSANASKGTARETSWTSKSTGLDAVGHSESQANRNAGPTAQVSNRRPGHGYNTKCDDHCLSHEKGQGVR
jgi:hypothetical protein